MQAKKKVVVVGAGTGGVLASNLLSPDMFNVTVVEPETNHYFHSTYVHIAFEGWEPEVKMPVKSLLRPEAKLVRDRVVQVDLDERIVRTSRGKILKYDYLIVAAGAQKDYDQIPGHKELVAEFGDFYTESNSRRLRATLMGMKKGEFVVAVAHPVQICPSCSLKAVFLASMLFRRLGAGDRVRVKLAVPYPKPYPAITVSNMVQPILDEMGIEVVDSFLLEEVDTKNSILRGFNSSTSYTVAVLTPPIRGPNIEFNPDVTDPDGFINVDIHTLQIGAYDDAYAVGDSANVPTAKSGSATHLMVETVVGRMQGNDARYDGRTNCSLLIGDEASFIISSYTQPPAYVRPSRFKRLLHDLFIRSYWSILRNPVAWRPVLRAYFRATDPQILGDKGW